MTPAPSGPRTVKHILFHGFHSLNRAREDVTFYAFYAKKFRNWGKVVNIGKDLGIFGGFLCINMERSSLATPLCRIFRRGDKGAVSLSSTVLAFSY